MEVNIISVVYCKYGYLFKYYGELVYIFFILNLGDFFILFIVFG